MKLKLKLGELGSVKRFVNITSQYSDDLSLMHDNYIVDAKSILGIFSMDLTNPIDLVCHSANDHLAQDLSEFVIA
jgi:phosphotransferase system HPr-like phosphotransfer protein